MDIIKLEIHRESGFFSLPYTDKFILTPNSISYKYQSLPENDFENSREWCYKTNNKVFLNEFRRIADIINKHINSPILVDALDTGTITFVITYSDKSKIKKQYCLPNEYFQDLFNVIEHLIPVMEYVPDLPS